MGSRPPKGSSRISSLGSCRTVPINCIFCCIPLDSSSIFFSFQSESPTRSSQKSMDFRASFLETFFNSVKNRNRFLTFIFLYIPRSSGKYPIKSVAVRMSVLPRIVTFPVSGIMIFIIMRRVVVFPAPLGPIKPKTTP